MKYVFILTLLIQNVFGQTDTTISFNEVVPVSNANKDQLYIRARQWFNEAFRNSKEVIQISDKETGELSGKGIMDIVLDFKVMGVNRGDHSVRFNCNVWVKDGKYKYEFTNFYVYNYSSNSEIGLLTTSPNCSCKLPLGKKRTDYLYNDSKEKVKEKINVLIASLKVSMEKKYDHENTF